jgi:hypothetical protein
MGAWDFLEGIFKSVAVGLLLIAMGWAAAERGRIHHYLSQQRRVSGVKATRLFVDIDRALGGRSQTHEADRT